jgi:outer membrane protein assembly factor BamB
MLRTTLLAAVALLLLFSSRPLQAADWPQWRGPSREGVSTETGLLKQWPEDGPPVVWQVEHVGVGYSSIAVKDGRIYTQGDLDGVEHVICLDEKTGRVIWSEQPEPAKAALDERVAKEFERLDKNADGKLDELEALAGLGTNVNNADRAATDNSADKEKLAAQRAALLLSLDANGNGQLDFDEVSRYLSNDFANIDRAYNDGEADAAILAASRTAALLKSLDKDGDQKISRDEARGTALDRPFNRADKRPEGQNQGDQLLTAEEITEYLKSSEKGKDGLLSREELATYYLQRYPGRDGTLTKAELRGHYGGLRDGMGDGPRGTPTVEGDRVYSEGGTGDLTCFDAKTGKTIWHVGLSKDLGGGRPGWGYSESPLIEGNLLIVTPGGNQGTVAALDKMTGEVVWRSASVTEGAHYASPVVADLAGERQFVIFARSNVFGVRASDGEKLWSYGRANNGTANCATPLVYKDHVFASSDYGTGGGLVRISAGSDAQRADEVYFEQKMRNHHGGIVRVGDYMYGYGSALMCMNFLTGEVAWSDRSVGKGSLTYADGMLYVLSEGNQVGLVEATPEEYREHGRFKIESQGRPSWAHPVVANGRFYIRNQQRLTAYDVKAK